MLIIKNIMNNTALITGASSGLGKEFAYIHAEQTGDLVIIARSEDKLLEVKQDIETNYQRSVYVIVKDLTQESAAKEIYDEIKANDIQIDYLINNAGFGGQGLFYKREWQQDLNMIKVNIIALTSLTRIFLPDFVQRGSGKILNVSSTASYMPGPLQAVYYATKAFVSSFSDALTEELRGTGVTVTALKPGATNTGFAKAAHVEDTALFQSMASPKPVAQAGYTAMLKGKRDVIAGVSWPLKILLPMASLFPKSIMMRIVRQGQEVTD